MKEDELLDHLLWMRKRYLNIKFKILERQKKGRINFTYIVNTYYFVEGSIKALYQAEQYIHDMNSALKYKENK